MTLAGVVTIVAALLTVLVLAAYLISVVVALSRISAKLTAIAAGIAAITQKAEPVGPVLGRINQDLTAVDNHLRAVLAKERAPRPAPNPPAPNPAAPNPAAPNPAAPTRSASPSGRTGSATPWVVAPQSRLPHQTSGDGS